MSHPRFGYTVLADAENIIVIPLYAITMLYTSFMICFTTWEFDPDTREEHEICCFRFTDLPSYLDPRPKIPILFEVIAQIAPEDCFFTVDGYESPQSNGADDERLATCWLETRPDPISETYWLGVAPAVQELANHIQTSVNTSKLLGEDEEHIRLQVCFQPPAGQSIASTLPLYDAHGERYAPSCIDEVPFELPVRAAFALEARHCRDEPDGERVLVAMLEHMSIL